ncbi:MAG: hypothetical protein QM778_00235 [Myxococcales bacterium]
MVTAPALPGGSSFRHDTKYQLDPEGRLLAENRPDGVTLKWERDSHHNVEYYQDANGNYSSYVYDYSDEGKGDLELLDAPGQGTTEYEYDPRFHLVTKITDARNNSTYFEYDDEAHLITTTDPYGKTIVNTWASDVIQSTTDKRGSTTTYAYDTNRRLTDEYDPLAAAGNYKTHYVYDNRGNVEEIDDNNGNGTIYTYDGLNRLTYVTDPQNYFTETDYTAAGLAYRERDKNGVIAKQFYDTRGYQTDTYAAFGTAVQQHTHFDYYANGSLWKTTNPFNQVTSVTPNFDPAARQVTVTDPLGGWVTSSYDAAGNLKTEARPGRITLYEYDAANRQRFFYPNYGANSSVRYETTYDDVGNVLTQTDPEGNTTTNMIDPKLNLVRAVTDGSGVTTSYDYDPNGNLWKTYFPSQLITINNYDARNLLMGTEYYDYSQDDFVGTTGFTYDHNGNKLTETDLRGNTTNFYYNNLDQLTDIWQPLPGTSQHGRPHTHYSYYADGSQESVTDPMGRLTTTFYDALGRTTSVQEYDGTTYFNHTTFSDSNYGTVQMEQVTDKLNRVTTELYDPLGRLYEHRDPNPATGAGDGPISKTGYNAQGMVNRTLAADGTETLYNYDSFDRVSSVQEGTAADLYTTYKTVAGATYYDNGWTQTSTDRAGTTTSYTYDGAGRQRTATVSDGTQSLVTEQIYDTAGAERGARPQWGPDDLRPRRFWRPAPRR